jgi:hypothetical protein
VPEEHFEAALAKPEKPSAFRIINRTNLLVVYGPSHNDVCDRSDDKDDKERGKYG